VRCALYEFRLDELRDIEVRLSGFCLGQVRFTEVWQHDTTGSLSRPLIPSLDPFFESFARCSGFAMRSSWR